jgi:hypothetical protein
MKPMKIQSNVHAGMTYEECDAQRNYWKGMAQSGHCTGVNPYPPYPPYPPNPYPPTPYPPTPYPPSGGGYVNGVYYPDYSGYCG